MSYDECVDAGDVQSCERDAWDLYELSRRDCDRDSDEPQRRDEPSHCLRQLSPDHRLAAGDDEPYRGDGNAVFDLS